MREAVLRVLRQRIAALVARAIVRVVDDATLLQSLQVTIQADEVREFVERFGQYGLTSVPHPGAEAVVLSVGGLRGHLLCLAVEDRRYRKKDLAPGEVALYSDEGDYVLFKRGRIVEVRAGTELRIDTPLAHFLGDVEVDGSITAAVQVTADGIGLTSHVHSGVQAGGGVTGGPQ